METFSLTKLKKWSRSPVRTDPTLGRPGGEVTGDDQHAQKAWRAPHGQKAAPIGLVTRTPALGVLAAGPERRGV